MSLTYGYDLKANNDEMMVPPVQMTKLTATLALPGAVLVNHLPFCPVAHFTAMQATHNNHFIVRHIPSWVPWFNYESLARIGRELSLRTMNEPINFVKSAMVVLISFLAYN
jgi:hypothetical protein